MRRIPSLPPVHKPTPSKHANKDISFDAMKLLTTCTKHQRDEMEAFILTSELGGCIAVHKHTGVALNNTAVSCVSAQLL